MIPTTPCATLLYVDVSTGPVSDHFQFQSAAKRILKHWIFIVGSLASTDEMKIYGIVFYGNLILALLVIMRECQVSTPLWNDNSPDNESQFLTIPWNANVGSNHRWSFQRGNAIIFEFSVVPKQAVKTLLSLSLVRKLDWHNILTDCRELKHLRSEVLVCLLIFILELNISDQCKWIRTKITNSQNHLTKQLIAIVNLMT